MGVEHKKPVTQWQATFRLFEATIGAITDDPTGHLPNCGATKDHPVCGCSDMGDRLWNALQDQVKALGL